MIPSGLFPISFSPVTAQILPAILQEGIAFPPVNPWMIAPFILLLLAIALMPLVARSWWDRYYGAVAVGLSIPTIAYYLFILNSPGRMAHSGLEYISFIVLIGSLYVVAGGIHINVTGRSTPVSNLLLLGAGAVMSNFLGTTGASMILIRPYLRANRYRLRGFHTVFFIFIVSNIGGALTPIGDPPLFLGYLRGVPFFWVLANVWEVWLLAIAVLLLLYGILDMRSYHRWRISHEGTPAAIPHERATAEGLHNLLFVAVILLSVFIEHPRMVRELLMITAAAGSYLTTKKKIHEANGFSFFPVQEVAVLFLGIFATMVPALDWLEANARIIGLSTAGHFYWGTGILSSVLDNAPTYLNFLSAAGGRFVDQALLSQIREAVALGHAGLGAVAGAHAEEVRAAAAAVMKYHPDVVASGSLPADVLRVGYLLACQGLYLKAISIAAVFFGAMTYIGNGPNFMVKSIADHGGYPCPGFIAYLAKYSVPVLLPLFALVWWLFFRT